MLSDETRDDNDPRSDEDIRVFLPRRKRGIPDRLDNYGNIESVSDVIWCDTLIDRLGDEKLHTLSHLQLHAREVKVFTDPEECLQYLDALNKKKQVFLILSGSLGKDLVPRVCHRQEIRSIYIFCKRITMHEVWAKRFPKIKGVFDQITELCRVLRSEKQQLESEQMDQSIIDPFQIFSRCSSDPKQLWNVEKPKSDDRFQPIYSEEKSTTLLNASSGQVVDIDTYIACSETVAPCSLHEQQMEYSDTETFLQHFHDHSIDPHMIIISNPVSLGYVNRFIQHRVRKLYIHCSNNRLAEYDAWSNRRPQLISVLQHIDSLTQMVLWDLSTCVLDIANYYVEQNQKDLAEIRYRYVYNLYWIINEVLRDQATTNEPIEQTAQNNYLQINDLTYPHPVQQ